jgi:hypothetical protein
MEGNSECGRLRGDRGRIAVWSPAVFLLLLPSAAMQLTDELNWDGTDFAIFGTMLAVACSTYELTARMTGNRAYRAAVGTALAAAFFLVWINLTVGIIGTENHPANLMFGGVLIVGIFSAIIVRFRPHGMARALSATAIAQMLVGVIVLATGMHQSPISPAPEILGLSGVFATLRLTSAWLFWKAAREQTPERAAS